MCRGGMVLWFLWWGLQGGQTGVPLKYACGWMTATPTHVLWEDGLTVAVVGSAGRSKGGQTRREEMSHEAYSEMGRKGGLTTTEKSAEQRIEVRRTDAAFNLGPFHLQLYCTHWVKACTVLLYVCSL